MFILASNIECIDKGGAGRASVYLVKKGPGGDEMIVGMLEKYRNTRTETHPWKAFAGHGATRSYLGAFYGPTGREDAIHAIEQAVA